MNHTEPALSWPDLSGFTCTWSYYQSGSHMNNIWSYCTRKLFFLPLENRFYICSVCPCNWFTRDNAMFEINDCAHVIGLLHRVGDLDRTHMDPRHPDLSDHHHATLRPPLPLLSRNRLCCNGIIEPNSLFFILYIFNGLFFLVVSCSFLQI